MFWKTYKETFLNKNTILGASIGITFVLIMSLVGKLAVDFNPVGRRMMYGTLCFLCISLLWIWLMNIRLPFGKARKKPELFKKDLIGKPKTTRDIDWLEKVIYARGLAQITWVILLLTPVILIVIV